MLSDWRTCTVAEFCPFSYGKGLPEHARSIGGDVPVFGSNGIVGFHDTALTVGPTVIIGRKGTIGAVHHSPVPCWPIDTTFWVWDHDHSALRFKYYLLKSLELQRMNSDSAVPGLNREASHARQIVIPPRAEQRAIAHILGTLDDKIELNRRMNATLEAMAQAIFKSWFVDFEPFRNQGMQDSPLGEIPVGWAVKPLDQVARFVNGLALQKYPPDGEDYLPVIKIGELRRGVTGSSGKASPFIDNGYIVEDGDVLFSWSGSLEVCIWCGGKGALNQHLFKVTSAYYPKWFYYFWIKHHLPGFRAIASGKATTMGHIQRYHLTNALVAIPPEEELDRLDKVLDPIVKGTVTHSLQSRALAYIRDHLLPKLLSGEIRVRDAETLLEDSI